MQVKRHESKKRANIYKEVAAKAVHYKIEKFGHDRKGKIGNGRQ